MKIRLFFIVISLHLGGYALPLQDHQLDRVAVHHLAKFLNVDIDQDFVQEMNRKCLRPSSQERWEMQELEPSVRSFVLDWAQAQGMYDAWRPSSQEYDQGIILGSLTFLMQKRLQYLVQLWNEGVRFQRVVWLTGDRPLDRSVEIFTEACSNESEAARWIWEHADLPEEMRQLEVVFIALPMRGSKRPNTEDTIIAWLNKFPQPRKALFISDQPFCGYQFAVIKSNLPESYLFDVAGPGADPASHPAAASITLDAIGRWLWQENQFTFYFITSS